MKLILGGLRGGQPTAGPEFTEYGGETTSFLVEGDGGERVLIDLGTGLRCLEDPLRRGPPGPVHAFLSHYHHDHTIGFPMFSPLLEEGWDFLLVGPMLDGGSARSLVPDFFKAPAWPIEFGELAANVHFSEILRESCPNPIRIGGFEVRWCAQHHPGGSVAYRIDETSSGRSLVIATDVEWRASSREEQEAFLAFCRTPAPADILVFDGVLGEEDYEKRTGHGHSTWLDALSIAAETGAKKTYLTHYPPDYTDVHLHRIEEEIQDRMANVRLGRQGEEVDLKPET